MTMGCPPTTKVWRHYMKPIMHFKCPCRYFTFTFTCAQCRAR